MNFLNTYAGAMDAETGEAVMVIVFFDDVSILGESAEHREQRWMKRAPSTVPPSHELPVVQTSSVLGGAGAVDSVFKHLVGESMHARSQRLRGEIPDFAVYEHLRNGR